MIDEQKKNEFKVGIVSITALVLLFAGIILGRGYGVSVNNRIVNFRFKNSGGLQVSAPIMINGVKRGFVSSVENNQGSVLVSGSIDNISDLKKDVNARITILEITGGKKLEINPGISTVSYMIGSEIPGTTPPDIPELVAVFGTVSMDLTMLIKRLDTVMTAGTKVLDDGKAVDQIKKILKNVDELSESLNQLIRENRSGINSSVKDLKYLTGELKGAYNKYEPRLDTLVGNLNSLSYSAKNSIVKVDNAIDKADNLLSDLRDFTANIKSGDNTLHKLMYDKAFAARIDSAISELSGLVLFIKANGVNVNVRLGSRP
ncbi:MAG: MlaD family protein [Candidatus Kapabacteria bacterium]|nr:MlaD family protein [Candidatus Kapabacteria bacterium]